MGPFYLTACAVVRDEGLYLREWLEFHRLQGIEHFFIYDNESTDDTPLILEEYKDIVTSEIFPGSPCQLQAYRKCLEDHGPKTEWMAFIDLDEFLYHEFRDLPYVITEISDNWKYLMQTTLGGIAVPWYLYGSSGQLTYTPKLVTERFLRRGPLNKHCKSIVRPEHIARPGRNAHVFYPKDGVVIVDEATNILPREYATIENRYVEHLRINHYHVKSYQEFLEKRKKPRPSTGFLRPKEKIDEFFHGHDQNDVFDASAARWVNEIEEKLRK